MVKFQVMFRMLRKLNKATPKRALQNNEKTKDLFKFKLKF